jgi:UDP-glucose 4-epimerase
VARYLVTGGCGFVGAHLVRRLLAEGHEVRVLDALSSGRPEGLSPSARCELVVGDVGDRAAVERCLAGAAGCFHLAAVASVARCTEDWVGAHRVNVSGAVQVFDAARLSSTPVVYASSAAVYGDNPDLPLKEDAAPRPLSAYAADKLGVELHARVAAFVHGVPTAGLRFFNVYGPGQDPRSPYAGVISVFADRLARGQHLHLHGDGGQVRDFVYVGDVVDFLVAAMSRAEAAAAGEGSAAAVYNVCTGRPTTIRGLVAILAALVGQGTPDLRPSPPRAADVRRSLGDPAKAARDLGCRARTALRDGLAETFAALSAGPALPLPGALPRAGAESRMEPVSGAAVEAALGLSGEAWRDL